jgi:hypothetical protein
MNPLKAHFRQPELYISLPSQGRYWPEGSVRIPVNGELPVYSMTAADEILMLTPDALINGSAIVNLIQNCIPNIQDAWKTPSIDLESLLIAIRIASNGAEMQIESTCPKCENTSDYQIDLRYLLDQFNPSIWHNPLRINGLVVTFCPLSFYDHNNFNNQIFQCKKKLSQASLIEDPDQKEHLANEIISEFNNIELKFLIANIHSVQTQTDTVFNPEYISEFVYNCDKRSYNQIKLHIEQLKTATKCRNLNLTCDHCGHDYNSEISLDYASFFE